MSGLAVLVVLVAGGLVGGLLRWVSFAERRREVRWSHTLVRFCGHSACRVCASRDLSGPVPRVFSGPLSG